MAFSEMSTINQASNSWSLHSQTLQELIHFQEQRKSWSAFINVLQTSGFGVAHWKDQRRLSRKCYQEWKNVHGSTLLVTAFKTLHIHWRVDCYCRMAY